MVSRAVRYRRDEREYWQSSDKTWERGLGDCEDFAVLIQEMCHELGFPEVMIHVYFSNTTGEGHAVAVGQWEGKMWMADYSSYMDVRSLDDVRRRVAWDLQCNRRDLSGSTLTRAEAAWRSGNRKVMAMGGGWRVPPW